MTWHGGGAGDGVSKKGPWFFAATPPSAVWRHAGAGARDAPPPRDGLEKIVRPGRISTCPPRYGVRLGAIVGLTPQKCGGVTEPPGGSLLGRGCNDRRRESADPARPPPCKIFMGAFFSKYLRAEQGSPPSSLWVKAIGTTLSAQRRADYMRQTIGAWTGFGLLYYFRRGGTGGGVNARVYSKPSDRSVANLVTGCFCPTP